tara:strand:+ start:230 stop:1276 length:1047 start_codon:yes stop_codon:yes gene_type:complete
MVKYNPLINTDRKRVEIVRPQIINTSIHQSADKLLIDKLENDKIMICKDDRITCSAFSIESIKNDIMQQIPTPLQAGRNIEITDNQINSTMYDDTMLINKLDTLKTITDNNRTKIEGMLGNIETKLTQDQNTLSKQVQDLYDRNSGNLEVLNKYTTETDLFKTRTIKDLQSVKADIDTVNMAIDKNRKDIETNNLELIALVETTVSNTSGVFEKIEAGMIENTKDMDVKIKQSFNNCIGEYNKLDNKVDNQISGLKVLIQGIEPIILARVEKVMEDKKKEMDKKITENTKTLQTEMVKMNKNMEQMNQELQEIKTANPNSKEFSRIVKKLTTQMAEIQSAFNFKHLQK